MTEEEPYYKHEKFSMWKLFFLSDSRRKTLLMERLLLMPKEMLAYFHEEFSSWEFPHGFRDLRPYWWGQKGKKIGERMYRLITEVCTTITRTITPKESLRFHNVSRGGMTNDEYEYWYHISHEDNSGNSNSIYYERRQALDKLHWWEDDVWVKISEIINTNDKEQTK